ncbi:hypothetical protein L1887_61424 [Cichorium endivia]|nr:hypothetical protein L1887_61424 [Cichorium endivia]
MRASSPPAPARTRPTRHARRALRRRACTPSRRCCSTRSTLSTQTTLPVARIDPAYICFSSNVSSTSRSEANLCIRRVLAWCDGVLIPSELSVIGNNSWRLTLRAVAWTACTSGACQCLFVVKRPSWSSGGPRGHTTRHTRAGSSSGAQD